jgi:hypothetical protein
MHDVPAIAELENERQREAARITAEREAEHLG